MTVSRIEDVPDLVTHCFSFLPLTDAFVAKRTCQVFNEAFDETTKKSSPEFYELVCTCRSLSDELRQVRFRINEISLQIAQRSSIGKTAVFLTSFIKLPLQERELKKLQNQEVCLTQKFAGPRNRIKTDFETRKQAFLEEEALFLIDSKILAVFGGKDAFFKLPQLSEEQHSALCSRGSSLEETEFLDPVMIYGTSKEFNFMLVDQNYYGTRLQIFFKYQGNWQAHKDTIIPVGSNFAETYLSLGKELREDKLELLEKWVKLAPKKKIKNSAYYEAKKRRRELDELMKAKALFQTQLNSLFNQSFDLFIESLPEVTLAPTEDVESFLKNPDLTFPHLPQIPWMMRIKGFDFPHFVLSNGDGKRQFFMSTDDIEWLSYGDPLIPQENFEIGDPDQNWFSKGHRFASSTQFHEPGAFPALKEWVETNQEHVKKSEMMPNPHFTG